MNKLNKGFALIGMLTLVLSLFVSMIAPLKVHAEIATRTVTIHKMESNGDLSIANYGKEVDPDPSSPISGVTFTIYDATADYYALRASGMTSNEALATVQAADYTDATTIVKTVGPTDVTGAATTTLAEQIDVNGETKDAIYVFVETDAPEAVTTTAENMVLAFPIYEYDDEGERTDVPFEGTVHLYPKNEKTQTKLSFTKLGYDGVEETPEPLKDVQFYLWRNDPDTGDKVYLQQLTADSTEISWAASTDNAVVFTSDEDGLVERTDYMVPAGTYYFEEDISTIPGDYHGAGDPTKAVTVTVDSDGEASYTYANGEEDALYNYKDEETITKTHGSGDTFDYGQLIPYTVEVTIPTDIATGPYTAFTITDTPDEDLELAGTPVVTIDGATHTAEAGKYTYTQNTTGFTIDFDLTPGSLIKQNPGETITITYNMKIKKDAKLDFDLENNVEFDSGNKVVEAKDTVVTGGFNFVKVDKYSGATLEGAKFLVKKGNSYYCGLDATGAVVWGTKAQAEGTNNDGPGVITSGNDGKFSIAGLAYGEYELEEILQSDTDEYLLPSGTFDFTIEEGTAGEEAVFEIENVSKGYLPTTGGFGSFRLYVFGAMMALVGIVWYRNSKKRQEEKA